MATEKTPKPEAVEPEVADEAPAEAVPTFALFTHGDVTVTIPAVLQSTGDRSVAVARRSLREFADAADVEFFTEA